MAKRRRRSGIWERIRQLFRAKWRLADEADELRFRLQLRDERIEELKEHLESYREVNDVLRSEIKLAGMMAESDLQRIERRTDE